MNDMRLVSMDEVCALALSGQHSALEDLISGEHAILNGSDYWRHTQVAGLAGPVPPDAAGQVISTLLARMRMEHNTPELLAALAERGESRRMPEHWVKSLEILFARYQPDAVEWEMTRELTLRNGQTYQETNQSILHWAISSGRQDIIDLCLTMAPSHTGRSVRVPDGLEALCEMPQGARLLEGLLSDPRVSIVPDSRHPQVGLGAIALRAVQLDNVDMVRVLARHGVDFTSSHKIGNVATLRFDVYPQGDHRVVPPTGEERQFYPIHLAQSEKMVMLLESLGADLNATSVDVLLPGENALFFALRVQSDAHVKYLVEQRSFDIHSRDDRGATPLHHAATCGTALQVRYLLEKGASASARDYEGWTPMRKVFSSHQSLPKVALLLAHGASLLERSYAGELAIADISTAKATQFIGKLFLAEVAQGSFTGAFAEHSGTSTLSAFLSDFLVATIQRKELTLAMDMMRTTHWDPGTLGFSNLSPVHAFIIESGAKGKLRDDADACIKCIDLALSKGFDLEFRDESGHTPLMACVGARNLQVIGHLVGLGADMHVATLAGKPLVSLTRDKAVVGMIKSMTTVEAVGKAISAGADLAGNKNGKRMKKSSVSPL